MAKLVKHKPGGEWGVNGRLAQSRPPVQMRDELVAEIEMMELKGVDPAFVRSAKARLAQIDKDIEGARQDQP